MTRTKDPFNTLLMLCGVLVLLAAIALVAIPRNQTGRIAPLTFEEVQVAESAARCVKDNNCHGGFVVRGNTIERIRLGGNNSYEERTITMETIQAYSERHLTHRLERIILPDHAEWEVYAVRHARQFIEKK